jgi:hypothetical protein
VALCKSTALSESLSGHIEYDALDFEASKNTEQSLKVWRQQIPLDSA